MSVQIRTSRFILIKGSVKSRQSLAFWKTFWLSQIDCDNGKRKKRYKGDRRRDYRNSRFWTDNRLDVYIIFQHKNTWEKNLLMRWLLIGVDKTVYVKIIHVQWNIQLIICWYFLIFATEHCIKLKPVEINARADEYIWLWIISNA